MNDELYFKNKELCKDVPSYDLVQMLLDRGFEGFRADEYVSVRISIDGEHTYDGGGPLVILVIDD